MLVSRLQDAWPELDESSTVDRVCAARSDPTTAGLAPSKQSSEDRRRHGPVVPAPARLHRAAGGDIQGRTGVFRRVASDRRGNFLRKRRRQCVP
jgi:hypothetical protein